MMVVDQDIKVGYKKTTVGVFPENWKIRRLRSLLTIGSGKDYKHLRSGTIPVYGSGGIMTYVDEYLFEGKSVCIGRKGTIDKPIFLNEKFWTVDTLYYTYDFIDSLPEYLFYTFQAIDWYRHNEASGVPSLSKGTIYSIKIALPPFPEQRKIAEILFTWDEAIAQTKALIEQLKLRNKGLAQQLLTGKKRLKGFSGEWKEVKLGSLINESRVPSKKPDPSRRISVKLNLKGVEKREERGTEAIDSTAYFTRYAGQFIYGKQNLHKGALGIIPDELNGFESTQDIPTFDFSDLVSPNWFLAFMSREDFYTRLESIATGTGSKRIHPNNLFKIAVSLPPIEEQKAIAQILEVGNQELNGYESHLEFLQEQKKGLMQKLLTGEVRVKID